MNTGALCGSSYLNEAFQNLLLERLEGEEYLEQGGLTIRGIVDVKVVEFENSIKRSIDVVDGNQKEAIGITYLKPNKEKKFQKNRLNLDQ